MNEELKIKLGVNEWLELIKEDKNLNGAYISISQYIYLIEKENQELKERLERINNYLDKYYSMENQYWFDHIRDIVKDR